MPMTIYSTSCTMNDVGIAENNQDAKIIKLYPNPASHIIKFELENLESMDQVHVLDVNGKIIKTQLKCTEISVSDLKPGIYFLQLKRNEKDFYGKFVKE